MIQPNNTSMLPIRRPNYSMAMTVIPAAFLPAFVSCSAETPQSVPEQLATPKVVSPFSMLADGVECVREAV